MEGVFLPWLLFKEALGSGRTLHSAGGCGPALRAGGDRYTDLGFPGSSAISRPKEMSSLEQGSPTVRCRYSPGWETYVKWWSQGADWDSCQFVVKTLIKEGSTKGPRVHQGQLGRPLNHHDHGEKWNEGENCSFVSDSLRPHVLYNPWNSPGYNTGVGSLPLLQGIFPTQGSNPGLLHCRWIIYQLSHKGSPRILERVALPFSRGSSQPRNQTGVSCIEGKFFTNWAIREDPPMEKSRLDDSDTYWCGIERPGPDLGNPVEVTIDPGKSMCVCGRVSSGPALSRDPTVPQRECPRGGGVLRAHGAPADHLGWEGPDFPQCSPGSRAASRLGSCFPSTLFPCAQSVPESAPKEMKVVVPVSARGPRDPSLWDLETLIPASAFLGPLLPWRCSYSF